MLDWKAVNDRLPIHAEFILKKKFIYLSIRNGNKYFRNDKALDLNDIRD